MIDPSTEPLITLAQAAELSWLPRLRRGRPLTRYTVHRWTAVGFVGIRLEIVRVGRTRYTSEAAIKRFFRAVVDADD